MGNSQLQQQSSEHIYIKPKKITQKHNQNPLNDITSQMQQVFGISNIPVSHRPEPSSSHVDKNKLFQSVCQLSKMNRRDKQYQERISNLESQIYYLRSLIQDFHDKSQLESAIKKLLPQMSEEELGEDFRKSVKRMLKTDFSQEQFFGGQNVEKQASRMSDRMSEGAKQQEEEMIAEEEEEPGRTQINSHYGEVNASVSRISQTYFQSRQEQR